MNLSDYIQRQERKHWVLLVLYLCFFILALFLIQFLLAVFFALFTPIDLKMLNRVVSAPHLYPELKMYMLGIQGFTSFGSMVLLSILFVHRFKTYIPLHYSPIPNEILLLGTAVLVILSMPTISWVADWNNALTFPPYLESFANWARQKEDQLKVLTEYITQFESGSQFLIGLLVIALIPALGEELMFRGVIQTLLQGALRNVHLAIFISGILFSAIHFQFFGFIPRALLGIFFGYLYFWSGSIWIPVCGHFVNNGFTLLILYLKQLGYVKINVESSSDMSTEMIVISFIIFCVYSIVFINQLKQQHINSDSKADTYEE